jgi:hypothetical protein
MNPYLPRVMQDCGAGVRPDGQAVIWFIWLVRFNE